ncbi:MAG TPA: hypothetical protein VMT31_02355 [Methanomicrobiales archaeon]|nr:hypothetical protein [Methanomicrobiales archaeon]
MDKFVKALHAATYPSFIASTGGESTIDLEKELGNILDRVRVDVEEIIKSSNPELIAKALKVMRKNDSILKDLD